MIDLETIGQHCKKIRVHLDFTQKFVADNLNTDQNAISRIEKGIGGSIVLFLNMMNFYSQYVHIGTIFKDDFSIIDIKDPNSTNALILSYIKNFIEELEALQQEENDIKKKKFKDILTTLTNMLN